jgi:8-oxo-dGTP diphosphatase
VSVVYVASAQGDPEAMDDAAAIQVFEPDRIPKALAFDHAQILRDYLHYRETGKTPPPSPSRPSWTAA